MERNRTKKRGVKPHSIIGGCDSTICSERVLYYKNKRHRKSCGTHASRILFVFPEQGCDFFSELVNEYRMRLKVLANAGSLVTPLPSSDVPEQVKENLKKICSYFLMLPLS